MNRRDLLMAAVAVVLIPTAAVAAPERVLPNCVATHLMVNGVPTGWVMFNRRTNEESVTGYGYTPTDWPMGWGLRMAPGMTYTDCQRDWHAMRRSNHPGFINPKGRDLTARGEGRQDFAMVS